jgi:hypothetical protein
MVQHAIWMQSDDGYVPDPPAGWQFHRAAWNELPDGIDASLIERLVLRDDDASEMPLDAIRRLPNLRELATECHLVAMTPRDVPNLESMHIVGTSEVELPAGPWSKLRVVEARDARVCLRDPAEFPALERLHALTKPSAKLFAAIAQCAKLRDLQIGPIKDAAALAPFERMALQAFAINRGGLSSLAPIAKLAGLRTFGAMNCHAFADLGPLAKLHGLEEVWFNTCAGIKKARALLELPNLRRATFWGCRENGKDLRKTCDALAAKGVTVDTEIFE